MSCFYKLNIYNKKSTYALVCVSTFPNLLAFIVIAQQHILRLYSIPFIRILEQKNEIIREKSSVQKIITKKIYYKTDSLLISISLYSYFYWFLFKWYIQKPIVGKRSLPIPNFFHRYTMLIRFIFFFSFVNSKLMHL